MLFNQRNICDFLATFGKDMCIFFHQMVSPMVFVNLSVMGGGDGVYFKILISSLHKSSRLFYINWVNSKKKIAIHIMSQFTFFFENVSPNSGCHVHRCHWIEIDNLQTTFVNTKDESFQSSPQTKMVLICSLVHISYHSLAASSRVFRHPSSINFMNKELQGYEISQKIPQITLMSAR